MSVCFICSLQIQVGTGRLEACVRVCVCVCVCWLIWVEEACCNRTHYNMLPMYPGQSDWWWEWGLGKVRIVLCWCRMECLLFTEDLWQIFKSHADLQTTYKLRSDRLNRGKPRKIQKTTIETGVNTCGTFKYKIPWWFSKNLPVNAGDTGLIPG